MTVTNCDMNALGTIGAMGTIEAGDVGDGGNSSNQYNNYGGYPQMSTATARPLVRSPPPKGTPITRPSNTSSNLSTSGRGGVLRRGACRGNRKSTGGVAGIGVSVPGGGRGVANEV
jgi:hypothetical protein